MLSCLYAVLILDVLLTKTIIQTESCKEAMTDRKLRPLDNPRQKMSLAYCTEWRFDALAYFYQSE